MTDWVRARAKCNVRELFEELRTVVAADVESAKKHVPEVGVTLKPGPDSHDSFMVALPARALNELPAARIFVLRGPYLEVQDERREIRLAAQAHLEGVDCWLDVKGFPPVSAVLQGRSTMALWQFSRAALEDLIFQGR